MSTVIADKKHSRFQVVHVIVAFVIALSGLSLYVMDDGVYKQRMQSEVAQAMVILGKEDWAMIDKNITERYEKYYYHSGIYDQVNRLFIPEVKHIGSDLVDKSHLYKLVNNISIFAYQLTYRITTMEYWLALVLPMMVCMLIHGFNQWRINRYRAGGANTSKARVYLKFIWVALVGLFVMVTMPNYLSTMGVYIPMIVMLTVVFIASRFLASYQKDL